MLLGALLGGAGGNAAQARPARTTGAASASSSPQAAIDFLDPDAGLILSTHPAQLQALYELAAKAFPEQAGSLELVAMGATVYFGFHPFQEAAWRAVGIDSAAPMLLQLAAIDPSEAHAADKRGGVTAWRSRLVVRAADPNKAASAFGRIRLRDRIAIASTTPEELGSQLGLQVASAASLLEELRTSGVFLLGRPAPLAGWVLASMRGSFVVVDLLVPYGARGLSWKRDRKRLLQWLRRTPAALAQSQVGAAALDSPGSGLWVRPSFLAESLVQAEVDGLPRKAALRRHQRCTPFRELAQHSSFTTLSATLDVQADHARADLMWHLPPTSELPALMATADTPLLAPSDDSLLRVRLALAQPARLSRLERVELLQSWDVVWAMAAACERGAGAFAVASAWPQLVGLFLDENAALAPAAHAVIEHWGGAAAVALAGPTDRLQLAGEVWIRDGGQAQARAWIDAIFGHRTSSKSDPTLTLWGRGPLRPYALRRPGGSILGAALGTEARDAILAKTERGSTSDALFELEARPSALAPSLPEDDASLRGLLTLWKSFRAELGIDTSAVHLQITATRDMR